MKKPVIIHYHIFKNAGSTIDWILHKNFGINALKLDDLEHPRIVLPNFTLISFIEKNPDIKSISSHQLRFPIPKHTRFRFLPLLFIRHPIDRAFSIYSFARRNNSNDYYTLKAKQLQLNEFIAFNLHSTYKTMLNFQTRFLSKQDNISNVTNNDLQKTCFNLTQYFSFGVVDRIDESLVIIEAYLRNYFPNFDMSYLIQNTSSERIGSLTQRLQKNQTEIDETLMHQLVSSNNMDFKLYEYANKQLDLIISKIDNFNDRLKDFKKRCAFLNKSNKESQIN